MLKPARWIVPDHPSAEVNRLAGELSLSPVVARVLWSRGHRDREETRRFLEADLTGLHAPALLQDMDKATERVVRAIRSGEHILLYGDYDVDGSTSVVILKTAIELAGGKADYHVPDRFQDGYGMRPEAIERAAADGVTLIISVDTGIRATESVERATELGIDVVITDHHLPEKTLPPALAVVNPNRSDCGYPDKNLCGAGVAFKLIHSCLQEVGWPEERMWRVLSSLLKMVAIATVADIVPLVGENRVIVKHGLEALRTVRNPGLRALLDVAGLNAGDRPTAGQVAFRIAPRINAAGRMANAAKVVELFLTGDAEKARRIAAELEELNQERQRAEAGLVAAILEECGRAPVSEDRAALVFAGEGWHRGVVGIVATKLVERFQRPVFVLSLDPDSGEAQGSGRSIPAFHLLDSLASMKDLFSRFGGHRQAAGLSLPTERLSEFRRRLEEYAAKVLTPDDFRPVRAIDAVVEFDELSDETASQTLSLAPFGLGNPAPVFASMGVVVEGAPKVFKEKHLRVRVSQNGRGFWLKGWNFARRLGELTSGARLDVAFSIEDDPYSAARGYPGWSLVLKDIRPSV